MSKIQLITLLGEIVTINSPAFVAQRGKTYKIKLTLGGATHAMAARLLPYAAKWPAQHWQGRRIVANALTAAARNKKRGWY